MDKEQWKIASVWQTLTVASVAVICVYTTSKSDIEFYHEALYCLSAVIISAFYLYLWKRGFVISQEMDERKLIRKHTPDREVYESEQAYLQQAKSDIMEARELGAAWLQLAARWRYRTSMRRVNALRARQHRTGRSFAE